MSSALFGSSNRSNTKNLVEFKAGKMHMKGKTVHPDKRKGQVYLYRAEDSLMHFCWKDRGANSVEEDLIIFPDDCEYKRIAQCTSGRVYVLRFKSTNRRLFFWMQEPKLEKDEEICRKVNELLNNPPTPGSQRSTGCTHNPVLGTDLSNLRDSDIHNFIGNISQQQLMQILGNGVPSLANLLSPGPGSGNSSRSNSSSSVATTTGTTSTATTTSTTTTSSTAAITATTTSSSSSTTASSTTTATTTTTASSTPTATATPTPTPTQVSSRGGSVGSGDGTDSSGNTGSGGSSVGPPIQLSDLQNILSGISVPPEAAAGDMAANRVAVDLGAAMTAEALQPILTNGEFVEQLRPYLPPASDSLPPVDQLKGTVSSPQFQQAVSVFSHALQSGELGPLINQFGLGEDAVIAASSCDLEAFIKALGKKKSEEGSKKEAEKKSEKDQDKDDDDSMAVD